MHSIKQSDKDKYDMLCKFVVLARRMLMRIRHARAQLHKETIDVLKRAEDKLRDVAPQKPPCLP
jgi:hypothetical protein